MNQNLENVIKGKIKPNFKSEGERRIAYFLEDNLIRYRYEPGVLINTPERKPRIWYPDFYLPEFGSFIEYYGLVGRQNYDRGIKRKEASYSKAGLDVIPIYPWTFDDNWQKYIMSRLEDTITHRYKSLMSKPYWSKNGNNPYPHSRTSSSGYRKRGYRY